ncbi:MAG: hypothetical protein ACYTGN_10660 [Planctomycetota bacterium]|jgi:hypothetical protein
MALNETHFEFADRGATSVYKFRFAEDDRVFVWFEYDGGGGGLFTTSEGGPYRVEHDVEPASGDLDGCLAEHGTTKSQWVKDLMAQFGERLAWTYP